MTIIAIDYDGTYTADPLLWDAFFAIARIQGHIVYCVTARNEKYGGQEVKDALQGKVDGIYFTDGKPKEAYMAVEHNIWVGIWIDDNCYSVVRINNKEEL